MNEQIRRVTVIVLDSVGCGDAPDAAAYGDAGAVTTNDADLERQIRLVSDHGRVGRYEHAVVGYGSRLDGLQAAILSVKLRHLPAWTAARRRIAARYDALLGESRLVRDGAQRASAMVLAEQLLLAESPVIPVFHRVSKLLAKPDIEGVAVSPPGAN